MRRGQRRQHVVGAGGARGGDVGGGDAHFFRRQAHPVELPGVFENRGVAFVAHGG